MTATKEVGAAVSGIQTGTQQNIKSMESSGAAVAKSTELAGEAGKALTNIVGRVESTADKVRAIATASEEQSAASEEISRGTEEVNRIAAETAQAMGQSAQAVSELAAMAQELQRLVDQMKNA
jgi:methyl-accepting chemotaxis protein